MIDHDRINQLIDQIPILIDFLITRQCGKCIVLDPVRHTILTPIICNTIYAGQEDNTRWVKKVIFAAV
jgi:hypothetical protein